MLGAVLKLKVLFASYYGLEVSIGSEICFGQGVPATSCDLKALGPTCMGSAKAC